MRALDQQPPVRPVAGIIAGLTAFLSVAGATGATLLSIQYGASALAADPWLWIGSGLNYLTDTLDLPTMSSSVAPWSAQPAAVRDVLAPRFQIAAGVGALAGITAAWYASGPPPAERIVGGRRVTRSPRVFRRALAQREPLNGVPLHPQVRISKECERRHTLVIAGTGAGKTQMLLQLMLAALERGDRLLIYDFKSDLTEKFLDRAATLLAPGDARSAVWDIAADVPDLPAARELAAALVPVPKAGDPMWPTGAQNVLAGLIVAQQRSGDWGVTELARAASAPADEIAAVLREHHPEAAGLLADPESRTAQSYLSTMSAGLAGLHDLARAAGTARGSFSVRRWLAGDEPAMLIVQHSERQGDLSRMLLRMVARLIFQRVADPEFRQPSAPTWLFLDEFLQAGRIETLLPIAEVARSKNVRMVLTAQDFSRLRDVYGRDHADALAGTVGTLVLGRSRGETARWASDIAGRTTVRRYSLLTTESAQTTSSQHSWQRLDEPVFRAEQFDSELGTFGRGRRTVNRLMILAGGDTLGVLDWPLTRLRTIAPSHVPQKPAAAAATRQPEATEPMRPRTAPASESTGTPQTTTRREQLQQRRAKARRREHEI